MHRAASRVAVAFALACAVPACDETDGIGSPTPLTLSLPGEPSLDGWVSNTGSVDRFGGLPLVGDLDAITPGLNKRQFVSFAIGTLPATAQIYSATVELDQCAVAGAPYATLGVVVMDHVAYGDSLTAADYAAPALAAGVGVLASDSATGLRKVSVSGPLENDRNAGRAHTQFRLRFSSADGDGDGVNDFSAFRDAEGSNCTASPPRLVVVYIIS